MVSNGSISTVEPVGYFPMLQRIQVVVYITADNIDDAAIEELKKTTITMNFYADGGVESEREYKDPIVEKESDTSCKLIYDVIAMGRRVSFKTSSINLSGLQSEKVCVQNSSNEKGDYYHIEVNTPNGENLYIRIRKDSSIPWRYYIRWSKKLCVLENSLSQITGVKLEKLYMSFDDITGYHAYSNNSCVNKEKDKYGYVGFSEGATPYYMDMLSKGNDKIIWGIMHEMSHSYGVKVNPSTFYDNYCFSDEYFTNARGLTAIQNCKNLKDLPIISDVGDYTYDEIAKEFYDYYLEHGGDSYQLMTYLYKLSDIGNEFGWDKLEEYFAANSDYDVHSDENKKAAEDLNSLLGISISTSNENYLRFVNSIRTLYKLCWNRDAYDSYQFQGYVCNVIGIDFLKEGMRKYYYIQYANKYEKISKKYIDEKSEFEPYHFIANNNANTRVLTKNADGLNNWLGTKGSLSDRRYLKFAYDLRLLYRNVMDQGKYPANKSFENLVQEEFGTELIKRMIELDAYGSAE